MGKEAMSVVPLVQPTAEAFAGCDDGHYGIKLVTEDANGVLVQTYVPSRVARGAQVISLTETDSNLYTTPEGQSYTVSDALPNIDTRFPDYALSDINRVLVHHALIKAGLSGKSVRIVTGLPVDDYFVGGKPNADFIERKQKSLMDYTVANKNPDLPSAKVVGHSVQAEAIAAFYDLLLDNEGKLNPAIAELVQLGPIAVVDIGGKTTDNAVIINGGSGIDASRSGSSALGALSLNVAVEQRLKVEFKIDQISPAQVAKAVELGTLRLFGKENDCSKIVNEEKHVLAEQIIAAVKRKMRDAADIEKVFFVGGGSALLREQLGGLYQHAEFVADPQFSNARGMFKIAKYMLD